MADAAPRRPRGRRHRRARVPGRGAGRRARGARRAVRAGHRCARPAVAGRAGAPADPLHPFGQPAAASLGQRLKAMLSLGARPVRRLAARCGRIGPSAVVGFGGYASVPTMLAARLRRHAGDAARAERRAGPRQPPGGGRRRRASRPRSTVPASSPTATAAPQLVGNPVRERSRALRDRALSRAAADGRVIDLAGARRQPGRARRSARSCPRPIAVAAARRCARACAWSQQCRARGSRAACAQPTPRPASWPSWRRSSPTCRSGWPARIW